MTTSDDYAERLAREEIERRNRELSEDKVGFPTGTLVHARAGLRRIEEISVGAEVLTVEAPGQAPVYRQVVRCSRARAQVVRVFYRRDLDPERWGFIDTTLNHLFWVMDEGWNEARMLFSGFGTERRLLTRCGSTIVAERVTLVFATDSASVGWIPSFANAVDEPGFEWDFERGAAGRSQILASEDVRDYETPFTFDVHELRVEGAGAFFVGRDGVLVSCHPLLESVPHAV